MKEKRDLVSRTIRIPTELYARLEVVAAASYETITAVVIRAMLREVERMEKERERS